MKKVLFSFALFLMFIINVVLLCAATSPFHYENTTLGFSLTVPGLATEEIAVEEVGNAVQFIHTPSQTGDGWGGLLCTIEVISPRSQLFSEEHNTEAYAVIAMGRDTVFLWKPFSGGVDAGEETREQYLSAFSALSLDNLQQYLTPTAPDELPVLCRTDRRPYFSTEGGQARPDDSLKRGELAEMLYELLDANNKKTVYTVEFQDVEGMSCSQAVAYLSSYGIFSGYPDRTFRPSMPVTRAEMALLLHHVQFATPAGVYGEDVVGYLDVPQNFWAEDAIFSASLAGWLSGYPDGTFRPDQAITRAEAVTALNRALGRDESNTSVSGGDNPFQDIDPGHWAYANILEASGILSWDYLALPAQGKHPLPSGVTASFFANDTDGWAASGSWLYRSMDSGTTWSVANEALPFQICGLFAEGERCLLLGSNDETPCILLGSKDGGQSWCDLLVDDIIHADYFPAGQFPNEQAFLESIVSVSLRPASQDSAYLSIWYTPYESIYTGSRLKFVKQVTINLNTLASSANS